jgi:3-hydroxybutyryl-CoA dehydratase
METKTVHSQPVVLAIDQVPLGLTRQMSWAVTAGEIDAFAALSGDFNPLHVASAFAQEKGFRDRVAHGMLLAAKISAFAGMILPGRDCVLLETKLGWPKPIFPGDDILITGEITELSIEQRVIRVKITAIKSEHTKKVTVGRGWILCQVRS